MISGNWSRCFACGVVLTAAVEGAIPVDFCSAKAGVGSHRLFAAAVTVTNTTDVAVAMSDFVTISIVVAVLVTHIVFPGRLIADVWYWVVNEVT